MQTVALVVAGLVGLAIVGGTVLSPKHPQKPHSVWQKISDRTGGE